MGTFATEFKGLYGNRNFYMNDSSGSRLACANSIWVFMDLAKGRPARPEAEQIEPYGTCPLLSMPYEGRKIAMPEKCESLEPFPVRRYHIDTNEHVNNCQYVQMALESVPQETVVKQLRVDYKKSAVLGGYDLSEDVGGGRAHCSRTLRWRRKALRGRGTEVIVCLRKGMAHVYSNRCRR